MGARVCARTRGGSASAEVSGVGDLFMDHSDSSHASGRSRVWRCGPVSVAIRTAAMPKRQLAIFKMNDYGIHHHSKTADFPPNDRPGSLAA